MLDVDFERCVEFYEVEKIGEGKEEILLKGSIW